MAIKFVPLKTPDPAINDLCLQDIKINTNQVRASWAPAVPTTVFDTYWKFAAKRQEIFYKRIKDPYGIWTNDPILQKYKFTNVYRASDRVSQYLIRKVIYEGNQDIEEIFFRIMLFKLFNKIETWELLQKEVEPISYAHYSFEKYDKILTRAMDLKQTIYSAAYIMPSGCSSFGYSKKHSNHLKLIEKMMEDRLYIKIHTAHSMAHAFDILRSYPTIGDFLAYQLITDINYSELVNFSEMEFVVPGPGAKSGIKKCFSSLGGLKENEIIMKVAQRQEKEFERLGLKFQKIGSRSLQLIDCQNVFCEIDKYSRIAHPEINGFGRTRIKQRFNPNFGHIDYFFPPKWGVNKNFVSSIK